MNHKPVRELTPSDLAVVHMLRRVMDCPEARWALGWGSEAFRLLCLAYADLVGETFDAVESDMRERQSKDLSSAERLRDLDDKVWDPMLDMRR